MAGTTTTYGTIPTSSSSYSGRATNFEYFSRANQQLKAGLAERRSWKQMIQIHSINLPRSLGDAIGRIKDNGSYFRMNYVMIVLMILFLSLLWHPISLIVFLAVMAVWLFLYILRDEPLLIFNRLIDDRVVMVVLSVVTLGLLLLTDATLNILVAVLVGLAVVAIHAAIRRTDDLYYVEEVAGRSGLLP